MIIYYCLRNLLGPVLYRKQISNYPVSCAIMIMKLVQQILTVDTLSIYNVKCKKLFSFKSYFV
jgi:hypothetical protein